MLNRTKKNTTDIEAKMIIYSIVCFIAAFALTYDIFNWLGLILCILFIIINTLVSVWSNEGTFLHRFSVAAAKVSLFIYYGFMYLSISDNVLLLVIELIISTGVVMLITDEKKFL